MFARTPSWAAALCSASLLALGGPANAQATDVYTYDVGVDGNNQNDIHYYGQNGSPPVAAYSIATQSCNKGTAQANWFTSGGSTLHPVIGQNMFRYKDGRFEQIGQSWLKHGFCAVNEIESFCAPCQSTPCSTLGIGCADTYWATLNDGQTGQSKANINATLGSHVHGGAPTGNATIRGRLQVLVSDIDPAQNPDAEYYIEGQYVTSDDTAVGNAGNNASWRPVNVLAVNNIDGGGPTRREEPAIYAWQDADRDVNIQKVTNIESAGKTHFLVGYRVKKIALQTWVYEYAIQNLNSDQSGASVSIPASSSVTVSNIGFHDVFYHSGDPYDGTDWPGVRNATEVVWATTPHSTNVNANALRWGTLYNFRFIADAPPILGTLTLGLFKPNLSSSLPVDDVLVPGEPHDFGTPSAQPGPFGSQNNPSGATMTYTPPPPPAPRYGSHLNLPILGQRTPAAVGTAWEANVQLEKGQKGFLLFGFGGAAEGAFGRMGEMLVRPPTLRSEMNDFTLAIPNDPRLVGSAFSVQAVIKPADGWKLSNALDVTVGSN